MSASVGSWFEAWLVSHRRFNPGPGWNSYGVGEDAEVFLSWVRAFHRLGVTEDEAREASMALAAEEPRYPEHHLARLLALVREARVEQTTQPAPPGSTLAAIRAESAAAEDAEAPIREAWEQLDPATRGAYLDRARAACAHMRTVPRHLIPLLARTAWSEDNGLIPRLAGGRSALDEWRPQTRPAPATTPVAPRTLPDAPPALPPEREAELTARCAEKRRADWARLQEINAARSRAS